MEDSHEIAQTGVFVHLCSKALESIQTHYLVYFLALALLLLPKYIREHRLRRALSSLPFVGDDGSSIGKCVELGSKKVSASEIKLELCSSQTTVVSGHAVPRANHSATNRHLPFGSRG